MKGLSDKVQLPKKTMTQNTMQLPKWKKHQEEKKFKRQKRAIFSFFVFILAFLFICSLFRFYSGWRSSKIKGFERINFLLNLPDEVRLVSVSKDKLLIIILPLDKRLRLTRGFGNYEIGKIFKLGEIDQKGNGLLGESIQEFFAVPIFGIIHSGEKSIKQSVFKAIWENNFQMTGLSWFDAAYLWWRLIKVPYANEKIINLSGSKVFDNEANFEIKEIDSLLEKVFEDEKIIDENLAVAVYNCTNENGLGNQAGRFIMKLGGRLVNINNEEKRETCLLKSNKVFFNSYTMKLIKIIFPCQWEEGMVENGRADIGIYLGQDYWKKLNEKW